jgi:MFS family permease
MALGTAWILDGLGITLAGAVAGVLTKSDTLHLSSAAVGAVATVYLVGEVVGALFFGKLSDKLGRRKLFTVTLGVYMIGSGLTGATAGAGPAGSSSCTPPSSSPAPGSAASTPRSTPQSMR